jgi:putative GTP pyrophosphokinase
MDTGEGEDPLKSHADRTVVEYLRVQPFYFDLAEVVARIAKQSLDSRGIKIHSVQSRAKDPSSFGRKASTPLEDAPSLPKYPDPLKQITDLAGVRIITHFLSTVADVDDMLTAEFNIIEKSNKGVALIESDRFGYQSIHYLLRIKSDRAGLPEYQRFSAHIVEVQVRTILQHAWAEIEHDIQYKSLRAIPTAIRRRFVALAGMLEIADREFQAIDDTNRTLEDTAKEKVQAGDLTGAEITPRALKFFLDRRLGPDGRMSEWSYDYTAGLLKTLGFHDLKEVEAAISPYGDGHKLCGVLYETKQGQIFRFEQMIMAALGEQWVARHPWAKKEAMWVERFRAHLKAFNDAGIKTGEYHLGDVPTSQYLDAKKGPLGRDE